MWRFATRVVDQHFENFSLHSLFCLNPCRTAELYKERTCAGFSTKTGEICVSVHACVRACVCVCCHAVAECSETVDIAVIVPCASMCLFCVQSATCWTTMDAFCVGTVGLCVCVCVCVCMCVCALKQCCFERTSRGFMRTHLNASVKPIVSRYWSTNHRGKVQLLFEPTIVRPPLVSDSTGAKWRVAPSNHRDVILHAL